MTGRIIHYYALETIETIVDVPAGSKILGVVWRSGGPALYIEKPADSLCWKGNPITEGVETVKLRSKLEPTGLAFETDLEYVGSVLNGLYVFHAYAKLG